MARDIDHLHEATVMLYENQAVAQAHAAIALTQELRWWRRSFTSLVEVLVDRSGGVYCTDEGGSVDGAE